MSGQLRRPVLNRLYQQYLFDRDAATFAHKVARRYSIGTLERVAANGGRISRRAAVCALGRLADYTSNAAVGRALADDDRGVRILAESALCLLWFRSGTAQHRRSLTAVAGLNSAGQYHEAIRKATSLLRQAPRLAEAWNQRAMAYFNVGRFADSVRDCLRTLALNPYHFAAAAGLGHCHLQLDDRSAALECFQHALRLNPCLEGIRGQAIELERKLKRQS